MQANDFNDKKQSVPWQRSIHFWVQAVKIYTGYKLFQVKANFVKDAERREAMWERQHEVAADQIYNMCSNLGGFFLKIAQIVGKPDLAPAAWVRRLVTLCDQAPPTPFDTVRVVLEDELGQNLDQLFERFDIVPIGSASIAQVHRARLKGDKIDVAVKVQHPGVQKLMMTDLRNIRAFASFLQKTDIAFDMVSITKEMENQVGYEFDFVREANAMERIRHFLHENNRRPPVLVPRVIRPLVSRRVLVMEYIHGTPLLKLGDEMTKRGINPDGKIAVAAKRKILKSLTEAYGQMILKSGFFHADPHPGNIMVCKGSKVALLDYGQVKEMSDDLRLGYAKLVIAIADKNTVLAEKTFKEIGIETVCDCEDKEGEIVRLAFGMFDTKLPPGKTQMSPFSDDSSIKNIGVKAFPEELFSVLRSIQLLRGLSLGMGINYSCSEEWKPIAEEVLCQTGKLKVDESRRSWLSRIFRSIGW